MDDFNINENEFNSNKNSEQSSLDANNYEATNSDENRNETSDNRGLDVPNAPLDVARITAPNAPLNVARITASNNDDIPDAPLETFENSSAIIPPTDDEAENKPANKLVRNKSIKTRVNELEKKKISDDAQAMHLNISDYIRSVALRKRMATPKLSSQDTKLLDKALREIKSELHRIGSNVNQIAKHANTYTELDDEQYMQFFGMIGSFKRIEETLAEIREGLK